LRGARRPGFLPRLAGLRLAPARTAARSAGRFRRAWDRRVRGRPGNRTGRLAHNADRSLLPASNEKLALTYAALVALGPSFRMRTEVLGEGRLVDGTVWHGDLILRGYGDPTLDRSGLFELARRLRATGVRRVTGSLIADESFFDSRRSGPGWKAYFVPQESSPLSALSVEGRSALETAKLLREAFRGGGRQCPGQDEARAGRRLAARRPLLTAAPRDPPRDGRRERQPHGGAPAQAARRSRREAGSTAAGTAVVRSVLAEHAVPLAGVRIADGSGLAAE
jgi:hypothetical protein